MRAAALLLLAGWLLGGCGGGGGGSAPGVDDPADLTNSGWAAFESGEWTEAAALFRSAIAADSIYGDAYNGLGWTRARADSLGAAVEAFDASIRTGLKSADPHAGKAVVLRDLTPPDYPGAIAAARAALSWSRDYRFDHDASFDWMDLRVLLAQSLFAITDYEMANAEVDTMGGTPATPGSPSFARNLLAEIERLSVESAR
ncbi:MAG: hypothetical protein ABIH26_01845 [Candidatus Eisenbacteria bacterium]